MDRIKNGFRLVHASWDVLRADREMLLLPILSLLSSLGLLGLVFVGLFLDDLKVIGDTGIAPTPTAFEYVVMALVTYLLSYITIFFNVALVCAADERMRGGDPTLRSALSDAKRHAAAIAPWALVSVVVSMVLRAIEERGGLLGDIAARMLGVAWALITFLVLPVLVLEGLTVREAITRSKELFTKTWGETVTGQLGMNLVAFVAMIVPLPLLLLIGGGGQPGLVALAVGLGLLWFLVVTVVFGALNMIFRVALYQYAADGQAPDGFEELDLGDVFPPKGRRGLFGRSA